LEAILDTLKTNPLELVPALLKCIFRAGMPEKVNMPCRLEQYTQDILAMIEKDPDG